MLPGSDRYPEETLSDERMGDLNSLVDAAEEALDKARQENYANLPPILIHYARLLLQAGQIAGAQRMAQEAFEIERFSQLAVDAQVILGTCYALSGDIEKASDNFYQAAESSRKLAYPVGLAQALFGLVMHVLLVRGTFTVALKFLDEINQLPAIETQDMPSWTPVFIKAVIYQTIGDRTNCRRTLDQLMHHLDPGTMKAAGYYLLWAGLALDELELERAKEYLTLGFRISNQHHSPNQNIWIRLEFSRYFRLNDEPATALSWAEDAVRFSQQQPAPYYIGLSLVARAQAHWQLTDYRRAEEDLAQAVSIFEPIQAGYDLARVFLLRAIWSRQSGKDSAARDWLQAARFLIKSEYGFLVEKEQESAFPLIAAYLRSRDPEVRKVSDELLQRLAHVSPPVLRIVTMGQFGVWKGRRLIPDSALLRRKAGDLLRYLLLQPNRSAGREIIIEALWPDHNSDSPFDLLHQATSALRHALESDLPEKFPSRYLKVEGEWISLNLPNGSVVDFEQFEDAMPSAIQSKQIERLRKVLDLYHGDLFPSDRYSDWSAERRQFLAELYQRGLIALAEAHLEQEQYLNVIQCCRNVLKIDPWNENAVLLSMRAFIGLDNVPQAMQSFLELEKILKRDLNIAPRYDLRKLAQTLQSR